MRNWLIIQLGNHSQPENVIRLREYCEME